MPECESSPINAAEVQLADKLQSNFAPNYTPVISHIPSIAGSGTSQGTSTAVSPSVDTHIAGSESSSSTSTAMAQSEKGIKGDKSRALWVSIYLTVKWRWWFAVLLNLIGSACWSLFPTHTAVHSSPTAVHSSPSSSESADIQTRSE